MVFTERATRWRFGIGLDNNGEAEIVRGAREWIGKYIDRVYIGMIAKSRK
jgi:hypothetical protein